MHSCLSAFIEQNNFSLFASIGNKKKPVTFVTGPNIIPRRQAGAAVAA
tara:strand:+ start:363 stop:506 length:144 start_codon:yes stop_codon:yes gene_type:complete